MWRPATVPVRELARGFMPSMKRALKMSAVMLVLIATLASGEAKKELRFTVGPNAASGYGFDPRSCPLQRGTMKCMLEAQLGDPVFDDPRLRSIYLTMEEFEDGGADSVAKTLLYKNPCLSG